MVVPEDWEVVRLGDKAEIYRGGSPRPINLFLTTKSDGINWIKIGDVSPKSKFVTSTQERIIPEGALYSRFVYQGDFILSNSMSFGRAYILKIDGCIHDGWLTIQKYNECFDTDFLYYTLHSKNTLLQYINTAAGSSVKNLSKEKVENITILRPPLSEQCRIAEVLSDTDAYISSLKKLIAKKEAVKQGVMQELLTGKKRLPGFSGEWVEKRLGDVVLDINTGARNNEDKVKNGKYPFFVRSQTVEYIDKYRYDCEAILIPGEGNIGEIFHYINGRFDCHQRVYKISNFIDVNGKFIYYYLRLFFGQYAIMHTVRATVDSLRLPTFINFHMFIPYNIAEQTAIANILSDMDQEIEALKKKLKKVESIKQGMMQKLLTGDIRLLEGTEDIKEESLSKPKLPNKNLYVAEKVDSYKTTGRHSKGFDDAVMIAGIVNALYSPQYPLGRKKLQKCLYLLRRYQEQSTEEFKKKAAGPYADEIRYKGGEPIAIKSKYIILHKGTKGTIFSIGNNINQALEYINRWNMQADIEWVKKTLKFEKVDKLELWATVDMAICDLKSSKIPISVASIKNLIATNKEWSKKLEKPMFSDKNIADAITILQTLFIKG